MALHFYSSFLMETLSSFNIYRKNSYHSTFLLCFYSYFFQYFSNISYTEVLEIILIILNLSQITVITSVKNSRLIILFSFSLSLELDSIFLSVYFIKVLFLSYLSTFNLQCLIYNFFAFPPFYCWLNTKKFYAFIILISSIIIIVFSTLKLKTKYYMYFIF